MTNKIKLTKRKIESLPVPEARTAIYHDTEISGFKLTISKAGTYTFMVYKKIKGRPERIKLGNFPAMTVEQARKQANKINAAIANGDNPNDIKRAGRAELTLKGLFDEYLKNHAKKHKRSWKYDVMNYKNHLDRWDNKKLSVITRKDVQKLHSFIGDNSGHYQANRVLRLLKVMFNKAIEWELWKGDNPANYVKQYQEKSRERFLESDEIPIFFKALAEEKNITIRDYILLSLLTGARQSNILSMRWDQISFERAEWLIPKTKSGDSHKLPLVKYAIEILQERKNNSSNEYVLSGTGKTGHLVEPKAGWKRVLKRAGIENLRLHDLRRSLGSWQAATGANLSIIGKTLAHKNISTSAIYARLGIDPVRESMEKAIGAIYDEKKREEPADIVQFKKQG